MMKSPAEVDALVDQLAANHPDVDVAGLTDDQLRDMVAQLPDHAAYAKALDADGCYEISMKWINLDRDVDEGPYQAEM